MVALACFTASILISVLGLEIGTSNFLNYRNVAVPHFLLRSASGSFSAGLYTLFIYVLGLSGWGTVIALVVYLVATAILEFLATRNYG
jgi:hypothetical protein